MSFNNITGALRRSRAAYKGKITMIVNDLNKKSKQKTLQSNFLLKQETTVNTYLHKIDKINDDIHELCEKKEIKVDDTDRVTDFKDEIKYEIGVQEKISDVQTKITPVKTDTSSHTPTVTPIRPPKLKCPSLEKDRLLFQNFLMQFNNVMTSGGKLDDSAKLRYSGYLTDYAFSVISHLSISNENYKAALDLLNAEFLDKELIIEEYFTKIISNSPKYDPQFEDVKKYLNETRACINDLKNYGVDLLLPNSSGLKLISHIVFNKLPAILKRELVHKIGSNYPSLKELFDNYHDLIKTIIRTSLKKNIFDQKSKNVSQGHDDHKKFLSKPSSHFGETTMYQQDSNPEGASALQNFTTQSSASHPRKPCKFCNASSHVMYRCDKYNPHEARRQCCLEMGLCVLCTSPFHKKPQCPGKNNELKYKCLHCKVNSHIMQIY